jgi:hypothetical protein
VPTICSITLDSTHGSLVLVSGETIIDVNEVHITRRPDGTFSCEVTRAGETPVRLVASVSKAGRQALEKANGRLSSVPGFIEVTAPASETVSSLREDIAKLLGWERRAED